MTVKNRYEGDPKLTLGPDGSNLEYIGGQPVMDQGLENSALIDLFTESAGIDSNQNGWWGNLLTDNPDEKIGSDFVRTVQNQPITLAGLASIEQSAEKALTDDVYGNIESVVTNPEVNRINNKITIGPPGEDVQILLVTENAVNWKAQAEEPAHKNLSEQ
jgi:phage gp46-like protein